MPRLRRKERADYAPEYVPEEEEPVPEDEDVTPALTETSEPEPTPDPYADVDETDESQIYVSRSTYDKPTREKPPEPVLEDVIQEHTFLSLDDLVDDDGGQVLGAELAEIYQSRSTYVLEPTPPKEPHPTRHRRRTIDDISPDDKELVDETDKTIYESESTYDIGEMGSVILEKAEKLIEKAKKTATETAIVSHSERIFEGDAVGMGDTPLEDKLGGIYESKSTYEVEKTVDATGLYLTGLGLSGGVSFVRGAVYTVNPLEWARSAHDLTYLARSRYAQKQFAESVKEDPLRFLVDTGAGLAGGYSAMKLLKLVYDTPDTKEFILDKKEIRHIKKLKTRTKQPLKYKLTKDQSRILHQKFKGWAKIPVEEELGTGFLATKQVSTGGVWPKSGVKGFGILKTGHDVILTPKQVFKPTSFVYKPIIDTIYGLKKVLVSRPKIGSVTKYIRTTRMMPDFISVITPGRSLSTWPFMAGGGLFSLTDNIPTIDEPIKGYDPKGITKTDEGLDLRTEHKERTMLQDIEEQARDILPDLTETFERPKPELVDPITILKPIHEPIQDPLIEPGFEPYPQIIEPVYEQKQVPRIDPRYKQPPPDPVQEEKPIPIELWHPRMSPRKTTRPKPPLKVPRKLLYPKRKRDDDLFGFEKKKYDILSPKQVKGLSLKSTGKTPKDLLLKRKKGRIDLL